MRGKSLGNRPWYDETMTVVCIEGFHIGISNTRTVPYQGTFAVPSLYTVGKCDCKDVMINLPPNAEEVIEKLKALRQEGEEVEWDRKEQVLLERRYKKK